MKKKLLTFLCMIICVIGLTACGGKEEVSEYQQLKLDNAAQYAPEMVTLLSDYFCKDEAIDVEIYTNEELEYLCEQAFGLKVDGYALATAVGSFRSGIEEIGAVIGTGETKVTVDGKQIVAEVEVYGWNKDAVAEVIFSNDMFMCLESASLNPKKTGGELMTNAVLNTVIGMGTVFIVLVLISFIISAFSIIPKLQAAAAKKKDAGKEEPVSGIENAVAQITAQEEVSVSGTDDLELVAVIAAAIAASEGAASTDGFVVRSIRKRA